MNVLTLKIPEELDAALRAASSTRGLSKSAVVREALEQSLARQADKAGTAERWTAQWRGRLSISPPASQRKGRARSAGTPETDSARLAHLLAKHLR